MDFISSLYVIAHALVIKRFRKAIPTPRDVLELGSKSEGE